MIASKRHSSSNQTYFAFLVSLLSLFVAACDKQPEASATPTLDLGESFRVQLPEEQPIEESVRYRIRARSGEILQFEVEQRGFDAELLLSEAACPDCEPLATGDGRTADCGVDRLLVEIPTSGDYDLMVRRLEPGSGIAEVRWVARRQSSVLDREWREAERAMSTTEISAAQIEEWLPLFDSAQDRLGFVRLLLWRAAAWLEDGKDPASAEAWAREALDVSREFGWKREEAVAQRSVADAIAARPPGSAAPAPAEAEELYRASIATARQAGCTVVERVSLEQLAALELPERTLVTKHSILRQAWNLGTLGSNLRSNLDLGLKLVAVELDLGLQTAAKEHLSTLRTLLAPQPGSPRPDSMRVGRLDRLEGLAVLRDGNADLARSLYQSALIRFAEGPPDEAEKEILRTDSYLAHLELETGNWASALAAFERLDSEKQAMEEASWIWIELGRAHALTELGRLQEADQLLSRAQARLSEPPVALARAHWCRRRALLDHRQGRAENALVWAFAALEDVEKRRLELESDDRLHFLAGRRPHYELAIELLGEYFEQTGDREAVEIALQTSEASRARQLLDWLQQTTSAKTPATRARAAWEENEVSIEVDPLAQTDWKAAARRFLARVAVDPLRPSAPAVVGSGAVRSLIGPNDEAYEFFLGSRSAFRFRVDHQAIEMIRLGPSAEIEEHARSAYRALLDSSFRAAARTAQEEARWLRTALFPDRRSGFHGATLVVPDRQLHLLPFTLLLASAEQDSSISVPVVATAPSFSVLASRTTRSGAGRILVVGDPAYSEQAANRAEARGEGANKTGSSSRHYRQLTHARAEVEALEDEAGDRRLDRMLGFDANREALLDHDLAPYSWLHFAAHGEFDDPDPAQSRIVLSTSDPSGMPIESSLTVEDIIGLEMSPELTVVSACGSGAGPEVAGEGVLSIGRAFLHAGAKRVLVSLWPVDDEASSEFMRLFYHHYFGAGLPPAQAVAEAQRAMRVQERWNAPEFWAPWVLASEIAPEGP